MQKLSKSGLILILGLLAMIGPLNIDTCLPAFGQIADDLNVEFKEVEFSMSLFFMGFGLGQLIAGYLSDIKGRKLVLTIGLIITISGSIMLVFVQGMEMFYWGRVLQALGGGFVGVTIATIVRDSFKGREAAEIMSNIIMIAMAAPLIAPSLGAGLLRAFGWHSIFIFIAGYGFIQLIFVRWKIVDVVRSSVDRDPFIVRLKQVYSNRSAMRYVIAMAIPSGALYTYLTTAPFIYQEYFGLSESLFAILFGLNGGIIIISSKVNAILVKTIGPEKLLGAGLLMHGLTLSLILLFLLWNYSNPYIILTLLMLHIGSIGFISGNATALALENYDMNIAGLANSQMRVLGILFGAFAGFLASSFYDHTLFPPIIVMLVCSIIGGTLYFIINKRFNYVSQS